MNKNEIYSKMERDVDELRQKDNENKTKQWVSIDLNGDELLYCNVCERAIQDEEVYIFEVCGYKEVICEDCWKEDKEMKEEETRLGTEVAQKMCKMEEQAIVELMELTDMDSTAFDITNLAGARHAVMEMGGKGYKIINISSPSALKTKYILFRDGRYIAHRDVVLNLSILDKGEE